MTEKIIILADEMYSSFYLLNPDRFMLNFDNSMAIAINSQNIDLSVMHIKTNSKTSSHIMGLPITLDMTRISDLHMLKKLRSYGIRTPDYYYYSNVLKYINIMKPDKKYLLKSDYSARSTGQLFVKSDMMNSLYNDFHELSKEEFNNKYIKDIGKTHNEDEKYKLHISISNKSCYLQEIVEFSDEYRILLFDNSNNKPNFIIEYREGYQIESEKERLHSVIYTSEDTNSKYSKMFSKIIQKLYEIMHLENVPFIAVDVYVHEFVNENNKKDYTWGVFEYGYEFGISYPLHGELLTKYYNKAMEECYLKLRDKALENLAEYFNNGNGIII